MYIKQLPASELLIVFPLQLIADPDWNFPGLGPPAKPSLTSLSLLPSPHASPQGFLCLLKARLETPASVAQGGPTVPFP